MKLIGSLISNPKAKAYLSVFNASAVHAPDKDVHGTYDLVNATDFI